MFRRQRQSMRNANQLVALCIATAFSSTLAAAMPQGATQRLTVDSSGVEANSDTLLSSISGDGRYVVFVSSATNLVVGDTNSFQDVFLRDTLLDTTTRVSLKNDGSQLAGGGYAAAISSDGRCVVFRGGPSGLSVRDLVAGTTEPVNLSSTGGVGLPQPSLLYYPAAISGDGRYIAFPSAAPNLVSGDTNQADDIFFRDRVAGTTVRVSVSSSGAESNGDSSFVSMSADGRFIAFASLASNLVANDSNAWKDVFVHDRQLGTTECVSRDSHGHPAHLGGYGASLSADGRFVAFVSRSRNLAPGDANNVDDVFVRDRWSGRTTLVSSNASGLALGGLTASISPDGRFVAFESAGSLVSCDTNALVDIYVKDRWTGAVQLASGALGGGQSNAGSTTPSLSHDGRRVVYSSAATNLVAGDTNGFRDIFLYELAPASPEVYCAAKTNSLGCVPAIGSTGSPSASSTTPFEIRAQSIVSQTCGQLCYSFNGNHSPFHGGWLCIAQPLSRTAAQFSGGSPSPIDCSGTFAFDFNAWTRSQADPMLMSGAVVNVQYVYRDALDPSRFGLTDALHFVIED
jgi:Tol biopolymer transport system component